MVSRPVSLLPRNKGHKSRKKAKERREEEERIAAREKALLDEVQQRDLSDWCYIALSCGRCSHPVE